MPIDSQNELRRLLEMRALQNLLRDLFQKHLDTNTDLSVQEFAQGLLLEQTRLERFLYQHRMLSFAVKDDASAATIDRIVGFVQQALKAPSTPLNANERQLLLRTGELLYGSALTDRHYGAMRFPEFALVLAYELRAAKELILGTETRNWIFASAFGENAEIVEQVLDLRNDALKQLVVLNDDGEACPSALAQALGRNIHSDSMNALEAAVLAERDRAQSEFDLHARAYEDLLRSVTATGISIRAIYKDELGMSHTHNVYIQHRRYLSTSMEMLRRILRGLLQLAKKRKAIVSQFVLDLIASMPPDNPSEAVFDHPRGKASGEETPFNLSPSVPSTEASLTDEGTERKPTRHEQEDKAPTAASEAQTDGPEMDGRTLLGELALRMLRGEPPNTLFRLGGTNPLSAESRALPIIGDADAIVHHCLGLLDLTRTLLESRVQAEPIAHRPTKLELLRLTLGIIRTINPEQSLLQEALRGGSYATSLNELLTPRSSRG